LQQKEQSHGTGVAYVLLATLGWSLSGIFVRFMPGLDGWQINCWRGFWLAVCLFAYLLVVYRGKVFLQFRKLPKPALLATAVFFSVGSTMYVASLTLLSVATVAVIGASAPLIAALLSPLIVGERPGLEAWIGALLALLGVAVIAWDGLSAGSKLGLFFAFCIPLTFAGQTLALRRYRNVDMIPAICVGGIVSFFLAGFMGFTAGHPAGGFDVDLRNIALLAAMALLQLGLPLIFYTYGARSVPAVSLTLISVLDSVLNPLWPWLVLNEVPNRAAAIGGSIILAAILFSMFGRRFFAAPPVQPH
jgi:drug/metabolite transporter, DME family